MAVSYDSHLVCAEQKGTTFTVNLYYNWPELFHMFFVNVYACMYVYMYMFACACAGVCVRA